MSGEERVTNISIGGSISMRERHGLHSMEDSGDGATKQ